MEEFPYDEIRNGPDGDRFNSAQEALDYLIAHHDDGGKKAIPTMDNVWVVHHDDGGNVVVRKNDDGTFHGAEVQSESYCAPNPHGFQVNVSGYIGTEEKRQSPDEMYEDKWEMPRNQDELLQFHFSNLKDVEDYFNEQDLEEDSTLTI